MTDDLVKCPHCNGSGKVPSSDALRAEEDVLLREAYTAIAIERTRYGQDAQEWADRFHGKMDRVEQIRREIQWRVNRALGRY